MLKRDFLFLSEVFSGFFRQNKIFQYFNHFDEQEITDFEPWLQIELAVFLSKMKNPPEWWREQYVPFNRSKNKSNSADGMKVDFQIRPYNHKLNSYIFLEIKQKPSVQQCITAMVNDLNKIWKGKGEEINNARSFWALGIHPRETKKAVSSKLIAKAEEWVEKDLFLTKAIPRTQYSYTLF